MVDSEHFYTRRDEAARLFSQRKQWLLEHFYRHMRVQHRVLVDGAGRPVGGQWNFDQDNRKPWPGAPSEPADCRASHDHSALWQTIVAAGVNSFGEANAARLAWPLDRGEALQQLDAFIENALPHFGDFQDAMSHRSWRMFHSLLSFALNTKMLDPREVVARAEAAWRAGSVSLATAEGFIRQIIGWREYIRGFYWTHMPRHVEQNFSATRGRCRDGSGTNSLCWDFFARNAGKLSTNRRLGMVYRQLAKMDEATRRSLQVQADELRNALDRL
ncbi:MAG: cryptochrome/photolyase family protein [Candidatus Accumulibacter sp.]|nr:cryptochrome/photolyase family protein [Accumulibacter sp.]MBO3707710.1 cryptochrome/photolyase family protein [Candidatus Accumulibacter conexus]